MRKTVECLSKSTYLRSLFEEKQEQSRTDRQVIKISNPPMHRWGSTEITLVGVLDHWDDLASAHQDAEKLVEWHAMEDIKTVLSKFHSILRPFRHVQVMAQSGHKFNLLDSVMNLSACYRDVCLGNRAVVTML